MPYINLKPIKMKKLFILNPQFRNAVLAAILLLTTFNVNAADYFWVGGTGNWSDFANHWATASGVTNFATQIPQSTDNVYFDANSFSAKGQSVTVDVASLDITTMDWTGVTYVPSFIVADVPVTVHGSLILNSEVTVSGLSFLNMVATTTGNTVTSGGNAIGTNTLNFIGIGGGWTLTDSLSCGALILTNGSLNTNSNSITANYFQSTGTNARTLTLGTSVFHLECNACNEWQVDSTGLTYSAGATVINMEGGIRISLAAS